MKSYIKKLLGITQLNQHLLELAKQFDTVLTTNVKLLGIVAELMKTQAGIESELQELRKLASLDVDLGYRGPCTVILTGVFNGKGYVSFYDMPTREFEFFVRMMQDRNKANLIRNIDAPPSFMASFDLSKLP